MERSSTSRFCDRRFQVGPVLPARGDRLLAIDIGRFGRQSPTVSVSTIGRLRIVRIEIGADLLAQRIFPLRQGELGLRHGDFGVGQLLLRVIDIQRRKRAQFQLLLARA